MTRVKVCGITNVDDALAAVDYGADALGFIFVPDTPRYVGNHPGLHALLGAVPPYVARVGVCRDPNDLCGPFETYFGTAQFYTPVADQSRAWYGEFDLVYAARVGGPRGLEDVERELRDLRNAPVTGVLLDTYRPDRLGGSGEAFDWAVARDAQARLRKPIILAGGLTPDNLGDAIAAVRPYAVDVSSGVEAEPGRKDHAKLRAFLRAVRAADRAVYGD